MLVKLTHMYTNLMADINNKVNGIFIALQKKKHRVFYKMFALFLVTVHLPNSLVSVCAKVIIIIIGQNIFY